MGTLAQVAVAAAAFSVVAALAFVAPRALRSASPLMVGLAAGVAIGASLVVDAHPTGATTYDGVLRVLGGLAFVAAGCYATATPRLVAAAVLAAASLLGSGDAWPAVAALGASLALVVLETDGAAVGAAIGLGSGQGALRLDWPEATGATLAVGALAFVIIGVPALAHVHRRTRRVLVSVGAVVAAAVAVVGVAWAVAALSVRDDLSRAVDVANAGLDAARAGDTDTAAAHFDAAKDLFARAGERLDAWWAQPVRAVPVAAQNARALRVMTDAGRELSAVGAVTARSADPDEIRPKNGVVPLDQVRALRGPLSDAAFALGDAQARLRPIDSPWLVSMLAAKLDMLHDKVVRGARDAETARIAVDVVPRLLGGEGDRRYFVAFQTPAELRASGGLIGNFAEVTFRNGDIELTRNARNSEYNEGNQGVARRLTGPQDYLRRYAYLTPQYLIQSVTLSPDFPSVAEVLEGVYPQAGGNPVDGVISLDPIALAEFLRLTGNVTVPGFGIELTPDNAADVLLRDQYARFSNSDVRAEFLKAAVRAVFDRLESTELPGPSRIGEVLGPMVRQRRLQIHSIHRDEQAFLRRIGADGAFPPVRGGDFLGLVTQNATGNKIDVFQQRSVDYEVRVDPSTGAVEATARIVLRNDAPQSGLPDYVIGSVTRDPLPRGTSRVLFSVYTPFELVATTLDGAQDRLLADVELGRNVYTGQIDIPPGGERVVVLHLRGGVDLPANHDRYRLRLWHQATVNPDRVRVRVDAAPGWSVEARRGLRATRHGALRRLVLTEDETLVAGFEAR